VGQCTAVREPRLHKMRARHRSQWVLFVPSNVAPNLLDACQHIGQHQQFPLGAVYEKGPLILGGVPSAVNKPEKGKNRLTPKGKKKHRKPTRVNTWWVRSLPIGPDHREGKSWEIHRGPKRPRIQKHVFAKNRPWLKRKCNLGGKMV